MLLVVVLILVVHDSNRLLEKLDMYKQLHNYKKGSKLLEHLTG